MLLTKKILAHSSDLRTVIINALVTVLHILPFVISVSNPILFFLLILLAFGTTCANASTHNHCHVPTIRPRKLNYLYEIFLSFNIGYPCSNLKIIHALNHHGEFGKTSDWSGSWQERKVGGWKGFIVYMFHFFKTVHSKSGMFTVLNQKKDIRLETWIQSIYLVGYGLMLAANAKLFLMYNASALAFSMVFAIGTNVFQHVPCDLTSKYDHSINFTGKFYNYFLMNSGFHTYHHTYPKIHWFYLPKIHQEKIDPFMKPECNQPNFLKFCLNYLF